MRVSEPLYKCTDLKVAMALNNVEINDLIKRKEELQEHFQSIGSNILRGSLIQKFRKCGKPNCHCATQQKHTSWYLAVSMPGGSKPIMVYVSFKFKEAVEQSLANYQKAKKILEELSDINRELLNRKTPLGD